jgi:4-hydroxy-2-oxoheptanedioate aldolase
MIEDVEAVRRIPEICSVPGIDVLFIGPADLAASLGVPGRANNQHPDHKAAVERVLEAGKRFGVPVGLACSGPEEANQRLEEGFLWLTVGSDARLLIAAAQAAVGAVKLSRTSPKL